jgi:hypothetical protein
MEPRFGQDFSDVRIHTGARATESARSIDALAYTVGRNVVFGAGQYAPVSGSGRRLLAHELAHVVQQGAAGSAPPARRGVADGSPSERASRKAFRAVATPQSKLGSPVVQRAMICSKPLEAPVAGWVANHSYIDDTGRNDCRGSGMVGNYAVQQLVSGNFLRGCAVKTDRSTDPGSFRPNMKPCRPKPGVTDVSRCLDTAFSMYANPSVYSNEVAAVAAGVGGVAGGLVGSGVGGAALGPVGTILGGVAGALGGATLGVAATSSLNGPNSNTFAFTLARACCDDSSSGGLGLVPGWGHAPARPCAKV